MTANNTNGLVEIEHSATHVHANTAPPSPLPRPFCSVRAHPHVLDCRECWHVPGVGHENMDRGEDGPIGPIGDASLDAIERDPDMGLMNRDLQH